MLKIQRNEVLQFELLQQGTEVQATVSMGKRFNSVLQASLLLEVEIPCPFTCLYLPFSFSPSCCAALHLSFNPL